MKLYVTLFLTIFFLIFSSNIHGQSSKQKNSLLEQLSLVKIDTQKVDIYTQLGYEYSKVNIDTAFYFANKGLDLSVENKFNKGIATSYRLIGVLYYLRDEYEKARYYIDESRKIREQLQDLKGVGNCFMIIALIDRKLGNYHKALDSHFNTLQIFTKINNLEGIATTNNNIAIAYKEMKNYTKAISYLESALKYNLENNKKKAIANAYLNLGVCYNLIKKIDSSKSYFAKSLYAFSELNDKLGVSKCYVNMGTMYLDQKLYDKAIKYYNKGLVIKKQIKKRDGIADCYLFLSKAYVMIKNYDMSLFYAKKGYQLAIELKRKDRIQLGAEYLAKSFSQKGNYKEAYKYHVLFKNLNDSLFNQDKLKKITALELQYKFDAERDKLTLMQQNKDAIVVEKIKKQEIVRNLFLIGFILMIFLAISFYRSFIIKRKANGLLTLQKKEIEEKNIVIEESLDQQKTLLNELHHRVKNNLQTIISLLNLQERSMIHPEAKETIKTSMDRIKVFAQIHHQLFKNDDLSKIKLNEYVKNITTNLHLVNNVKNNTKLELIIDENLESNIDSSITLGLIINELMTNSFKHMRAVEKQNFIAISLTKKEGVFKFQYKDNGASFDVNKLLLAKNKSLGVQLVKRLVNQLGSEITFDTSNGMSAYFEFKLDI